MDAQRFGYDGEAMTTLANSQPPGAASPRPPRSRTIWTWAVLALAVAGLIGGGAWFWKGMARDHLVLKRWGMVEPGLYRSGQISSFLVKSAFERYHIGLVIDLTHDAPADPYQAAEAEAARQLGIERVRFPLQGDGVGDIHNYALAVAAIARRGRRTVLVHCAAGTQRTGGVVAMYRVLVEKRPPPAAWTELTRYGWSPTRDRVLVEFLNSHMGVLAAQLKAMGVIAKVPDPLPLLRP